MPGTHRPLTSSEEGILKSIISANASKKRGVPGVLGVEVAPGESVAINKLVRHGLIEKVPNPKAASTRDAFFLKPTKKGLKARD